tara:strand:- start:394 stop:1032 length:639 start_codon:yes stop_codon:yes gene_type:complete
MEIQISRPFGPSIAKVTIPEKMVADLNNYVDKIIINETKSKGLNLGLKLAGDVTQEFKLEEKFSMEIGWIKFLGQCTQEWIKATTNNKITKFNLRETWIVRQFKNEYNPIHWHGGHISGAGFLKVPDSLGKHVQDKGGKEYQGGSLELIHGSRQFLSNSKFKITPKVGDFYFFPHYLMHTVYPFKGTDDERRSISFNAIIDQNIFDVHGRNQ